MYDLLLLLSNLPVRHWKAYMKGPSLYEVLTYSLEAQREPRTTNRTGQIICRKNLLQGWTGTTGHPETGQVPHLEVKPGEAT